MCTTTPVGGAGSRDPNDSASGSGRRWGFLGRLGADPDAGIVLAVVEYWRGYYYAYALWVPPPWIRLTEFTSLHAAFTAALGWVVSEWQRRRAGTAV